VKQDHPYTITAKPRHLNLLFYVNDDFEVARLRKLILKNLTLWGGRYNPIIPFYKKRLKKEWGEILKFQDPDYVYFSPGIDKEFIKDICDEFEHNPIEIIELDERLLGIHGVHYANIMPLIPSMQLPRAYNLWEIDTLLADCYGMNFLVENTLPVNDGPWTQANDGLFQNHQLSLVNKASFYSINSLWANSHVKSITELSGLNTNLPKLRLANPIFHGFELIVAADNNGFEELIYHWNKALYDIYAWNSLTIMVTVSELELLIGEESFKGVLKKYSGQNLTIGIVSFSLSNDALKNIVAQLKAYSNLNDFVIKHVTDFPFAVRDREGLNQQSVYEKKTTQVIFKTQPFIFLPKLSFELVFKPFSQRYGFDLKISEVLGPFNKSLRFPLKLNADVFVRQESRIDRRREIFVRVDEPLHLKGELELSIPELFNVISMVITSPRVAGSQGIKNVYRGIRFSDSSNKLAQFLKLFDDDFVFLQDYLHDKFWNDIFLELSDNNRTEGDTIIFEEIYSRCHQLMIGQGKQFTLKEEGRFNIENLRLGLKAMLQDLIDHKIFLPGYIIKCSSCSSKVWYSINEINNMVICKGCSSQNHFVAENPIAYKLNHLVKNNYGMKDDRGVFMPDGNMTAIRTLLYIWNQAVNSFQFLPQIDILDCSGDPKPMTDLDIVAMSAGYFYIGECKHSSDLFYADGKKCLHNLIKIAETAKPDKIILACTEDVNNKLHNSAEFIRHQIKNWKNPPKVIEYKTWQPTYFEQGDGRYFFY
jgi:hypothetical protein